MNTQPTNNEFQTAVEGALWCVQQGLKVFPTKGKLPACAWSDPKNLWGEENTEKIKTLITDSYGVSMKASHLIVIDDDGNGELARWFNDRGESIPETFTVKTAKGYHYYFDARENYYGNNNPFKKHGYKIDVRGNGTKNNNGGYVVGMGSLHETGIRYQPVDINAPILPLPEQLHDFLKGQPATTDTLPTATNSLTGKPTRKELTTPTVAVSNDVSLNSVLSGTPNNNHDQWFKIAVERELKALHDLQGVPDNGEDCWDNNTYAHASRLIELGNHPECPYTLEELETRFMDNAPVDENFGRTQHEHKWNDARKKIGGKPAEIKDKPVSTPWDDVHDPKNRPDITYEEKLNREVERLRIREEARRVINTEKAKKRPIPDGQTLTAFLDEQDEETAYLIDDVWPIGGKGILVAQAKTGKTTTVMNLIRSLVDGEEFLDKYPTHSTGKVVLIDFEMNKNQIRKWLRDQRIQNTNKVEIFPLRGLASTFDIIQNPETQTEWAGKLHGADVIIIDCLRPALDAIGRNENNEAGIFLNAVDELMEKAKGSNYLIVHHMGHQDGETGKGRARGDSRIKDWPDFTMTLTTEHRKGEKMGDDPRYFKCMGRDVDIPEKLMAYDPLTRRLSLTDKTPAVVKAQGAVEPVYEYIENHPGCCKSDIEDKIPGLTRDSKMSALKILETNERIRVEKSRAHRFYTTTPQLPEPPHGGRGDGGTINSPTPHPVYNTGSGEMFERKKKTQNHNDTCPVHGTELDGDNGCAQCQDEQ